MEQFAEEQRRKWEQRVAKMNLELEKAQQQAEKERQEAENARIAKLADERRQKEKAKQEELRRLREERELKIAEKKHKELMKKLQAQQAHLEQQKKALFDLELRIARGKAEPSESQESSLKTAEFHHSQTVSVDQSFKSEATLVEMLEDDDPSPNKSQPRAVDRTADESQLMVDTTQIVEPHVAVVDDILMQSCATIMTEIANVPTDHLRAATDLEKSFDQSVKGARYQNFISNEATMEDVDIQLPDVDQSMGVQSAGKSSVATSQYSRKEQIILELELKSNVSAFRRQLNNQSSKELEERQRLQQEVLKHIFHGQKPPGTKIEKIPEEDSKIDSTPRDQIKFEPESSFDRSSTIPPAQLPKADKTQQSRAQVDKTQKSQFTGLESSFDRSGTIQQPSIQKSPYDASKRQVSSEGSFEERASDQRSLDEVTVRSAINSIRRSTATVTQQVQDDLSCSGLFSRASDTESMLQMSFSRFQQHMVNNLPPENDEEIDFELSKSEFKMAELRALRQAQAEIEISQSLLSDAMEYSQSKSVAPMDFVGHSQISGISMVPTLKHDDKSFALNSFAEPLNNGRGFFYGAEEAGISLASKDFESAYNQPQPDASQSFVDARNILPPKLRKADDDTVMLTEHQLMDSQASSLVNMAVSMDHFTAHQKFKIAELKAIYKMQQFLSDDLPETKSPDRQNYEEDDDYQSDKFESDAESSDKEVKEEAKKEYRPQLSMKDQPEATAQELNLVEEQSSSTLRGTSRFGATMHQDNLSDKTFDPIVDYNNNDEPTPPEAKDTDFQPRERLRWNRESFGEIETPQQQQQPVEEDFIAVKKPVKQAAVLLDFNESLDDIKKRKFEEFKARQAMRQQHRSRSKPKQEPDAPSEQFKKKYAVLGGGKSQKPDRIIIRKLQEHPTDNDENAFEQQQKIRLCPQTVTRSTVEGGAQLPELEKAAPTTQQQTHKSPAQQTSDVQMTPAQLANQRGPRKLSPYAGRASPKALNTPSILPKKAFTKQTNSQVIKLALSQVSLAGEVNQSQRQELLELILTTSGQNNFVIVFRGSSKGYRALYQFDGQECTWVHGSSQLPQVLSTERIESCWRYQTSQKDFVLMEGVKSVTLTTDAVTLKQK